jgi:hypothetical protein
MGQSWRELIAWQKAMNFVMDTYGITKSCTRDQAYGRHPSATGSCGHANEHRRMTSKVFRGAEFFHPWRGREVFYSWSRPK